MQHNECYDDVTEEYHTLPHGEKKDEVLIYI